MFAHHLYFCKFFCSVILLFIFLFFLVFLKLIECHNNSEKTDIESTHSSNVSGYPPSIEKQQQPYNQQQSAIIPPDALYTTANEKMMHMTQNPSPHPFNNQQQQFGYEADFNDSKVTLKSMFIAGVSRLHYNQHIFYLFLISVPLFVSRFG